MSKDTTTTSANKKTVMDVFAAITEGNLEKLGALLADGAVWWITGSTRISGEHRKKGFLEAVPRVFADAAGPIVFSFSDITAEEDRVSVIASGDMPLKSGKRFASHYHYLFKLRDGKITYAREYMDTAHFNDTLGI